MGIWLGDYLHDIFSSGNPITYESIPHIVAHLLPQAQVTRPPAHLRGTAIDK